MKAIKPKVQISIPFNMLHDTYLDRFLAEGLNPEIAIEAASLDRFKRSDFVRVADEFHNRSLRITLHGPFMDLAAGSADAYRMTKVDRWLRVRAQAAGADCNLTVHLDAVG